VATSLATPTRLLRRPRIVQEGLVISLALTLLTLGGMCNSSPKGPEASNLIDNVATRMGIPSDPRSRWVELEARSDSLSEQGLYAQATVASELALKTAESAFGTRDPHTAESLIALAYLYALQGKAEEAEPLCRRALSLMEAAVGDRDTNTVRCAFVLAGCCFRVNKLAEAETLYRRGN